MDRERTRPYTDEMFIFAVQIFANDNIWSGDMCVL